MKVDLLWRHAMNFPLRHRNPMKHRNGLFFHPGRERTFANQRFYLGKVSPVLMIVLVAVRMGMIRMFVFMRVRRVMALVFVWVGMLRSIGMSVFVGVRVFMFMRFVMLVIVFFVFMRVRMLGAIRVRVLVSMSGPMRMIVIAVMRQMDIKLHSLDLGLLLARGVQMVAIEFQFPKFVFQFVKIHAEVEQRPDEHVAADAAENIEIKSFHITSCSPAR